MGMEKLISIYTMCFWGSLVLAVLGTLLAALIFWKYNIRNVWLIRSGRERRKTVQQMQAQSLETGTLKPGVDMDFTTGSMTQETDVNKADTSSGQSSGKTAANTEESAPKKRVHSGETGQFRTEDRMEMPEAQKVAVMEADRRAETRETSVLGPVGETCQLDTLVTEEGASSTDVTAAEYAGDTLESVYPEEPEEITKAMKAMPFRIIERDVSVHTDEIVEV